MCQKVDCHSPKEACSYPLLVLLVSARRRSLRLGRDLFSRGRCETMTKRPIGRQVSCLVAAACRSLRGGWQCPRSFGCIAGLIRPMSAETRSFRDVQCMTALPPKAEVHP
jgi:hypothetical protein